jgi:hypothetical protein
MTKALDLVVKYQKIPFEDPKYTWPNLGHTSLLTPYNVVRTSTCMVHARFFNVFAFLVHIVTIIHVE